MPANLMMLRSGSHLGPYEIISPLGVGGMGEVYKARDTRLERTVALKVLPTHIAGREDLRQRFEREARAVSGLKHPHICVLHDVGRHDGVDYIVMEHLEGETLADLIKKGSLPLDQALKYSMQMADALDRAHRSGVVHRDVKPSNMIVTRDGLKVLDFGLAKAAPKTVAAADDATLTAALTGEGTVLGTAQYMAPEQYQGKEADERSDTFAFGCVVYEMVTGRRAFDGKTKASVVAAVLGAEPPPMSTLKPVTPRALEKLVRRCLAKDPEERWQSIRDVLLELRSIADAPEQPAVGAVKRRWLLPLLTGLLAVLAIAASWISRRAEPPSQSYRFSITPPSPTVMRNLRGGLALSPDGTMLVYTGITAGKTQLWVRRLDSLTSRALAGTEEGIHPFWSPDSRWIGFFAGGKLKKTDVSGGLVQSLCDVPSGIGGLGGGTWNADGVILFSTIRAINRVAAAGGTPAAVTALDLSKQEFFHGWPWFLPNGRHFLYFANSSLDGNRGIYAASLDAPADRKLVAQTTSGGVFSASPAGFLQNRPGYLIYVLRDQTLIARPFDVSNLVFKGDAFPVAERLSGFLGRLNARPHSVSANGILAYETGGVAQRLVWRERNGRLIEPAGEQGIFGSPSLSPDGRRLGFGRAEGGNLDLWIQDVTRGTPTRFTFYPELDAYFVWSPAGDQVLFFSASGPGLYRSLSNSAGTPELFVKQMKDGQFLATDWSGDGNFVLISVAEGPDSHDLMVVPLRAETKPIPLLTTPFSEQHARFSPSSSAPPKWFAYDSNLSGARQVYVQAFTPGRPASGARWQVSTTGGTEPRWRGDGKELYYLSPDQKIMAVNVKTDGDVFEAGTPVALFETSAWPLAAVGWSYDVTRDGQRFILMEQVAADSSQPIAVVVNWMAGLKQ